jgi:hypothetical protein
MTTAELLAKLSTILGTRSGRDALIDALDAYVDDARETIELNGDDLRRLPRDLPLRMMAAEDALLVLNTHRAELVAVDPLATLARSPNPAPKRNPTRPTITKSRHGYHRASITFPNGRRYNGCPQELGGARAELAELKLRCAQWPAVEALLRFAAEASTPRSVRLEGEWLCSSDGSPIERVR